MKKLLKPIALILALLLAVLCFSTPNNSTASGHNMTATTLSMTVGTKQSMTVPGVSSSKVKWKSNKTSIATVDKKGVVKAKKAGSATITGTYQKIKFTCKVTVTATKGTTYNKTLVDNSKLKVVLTSITQTKFNFKVTNKTNKGIFVTIGDSYIQLDGKSYYDNEAYERSYPTIAPHDTRTFSGIEFGSKYKLSKTNYSKLNISVIGVYDDSYSSFYDKRMTFKLK